MAGFDESELFGGVVEHRTCQVCSKSEWISTGAAAADGWKYLKAIRSTYSICPECAGKAGQAILK